MVLEAWVLMLQAWSLHFGGLGAHFGSLGASFVRLGSLSGPSWPWRPILKGFQSSKVVQNWVMFNTFSHICRYCCSTSFQIGSEMSFQLILGGFCGTLWESFFELFGKTSISWFSLPLSRQIKVLEVLRHHILGFVSLIFWCFFEVQIFIDFSAILEPFW